MESLNRQFCEVLPPPSGHATYVNSSKTSVIYCIFRACHVCLEKARTWWCSIMYAEVLLRSRYDLAFRMISLSHALPSQARHGNSSLAMHPCPRSPHLRQI